VRVLAGCDPRTLRGEAITTRTGSSMDATTLLITVYCLIDGWLAGRRLRQRGPTPVLSDGEVLTVECVGEFLGIDTDKGLYDDFRRHYRDWLHMPEVTDRLQAAGVLSSLPRHSRRTSQALASNGHDRCSPSVTVAIPTGHSVPFITPSTPAEMPREPNPGRLSLTDPCTCVVVVSKAVAADDGG
jgi:hypothetical protein